MVDPNQEPLVVAGVECESGNPTQEAGVGCATTKQRFLGQLSAGFVLPFLRISEEAKEVKAAKAGQKRVARGARRAKVCDTGLAAGSSSGGAFPLSMRLYT